MNIGIIACSGGSVFKEIFSICKKLNRTEQFFVITDRACGIEDFCKIEKIPFVRIECKNNEEFSYRAKEQFQTFGSIDYIVLFFLRILSEQIHKSFLTFNIHPSLLPSFPGLNPIKQAMLKKVRFLGTTLHIVNDILDDGRIVGQICNPISENFSEKKLLTMSFLQKVYLFILLLELMEKKAIITSIDDSEHIFINEMPSTINANPCFTNPLLINSFRLIQSREGIEVIL